MSHKSISRPSDIPKTTHWAAFAGSSYHTPADQRSIDHPGHGYPASDTNYIEYHAFDTEEDLIAWISYQRYGGSYIVAKVEPLKVKQTFSIG